MQRNTALSLRQIVARSLWPSYGARANAADALQDVRRGREERAQAAAAFAAARACGLEHAAEPEASR